MGLKQLDDLQDFPMGYFWYVQRWYDEDGVPHYHGVRSEHDRIEKAQATMRFNVIAAPVDLVYGPCEIDDLHDYLGDVLAYPPPDDGDPDVGDLSWKA